MAKLYTSDLHFNHANIIKPDYTRRGETWADIPAMNEGLILRYNQVVQPDDEVYIIGDFAMGDKSAIPGIAARLMGKKILVLGNHDYKKPGLIRPEILEALDKGYFHEVLEETIVIDGENHLYLRHEPKHDWLSDDFDYHLCGHVHESFSSAVWDPEFVNPDTGGKGGFVAKAEGRIINVGVDVSDYTPMTLEQLLARPLQVGKRHRI